MSKPCVYFLRSKLTGLTKIGYTAYFDERFGNLSRHFGDLDVVMVFERHDALALEKMFHHRLDHVRTSVDVDAGGYTEWFHLTADDIDAVSLEIERIPIPPEPKRPIRDDVPFVLPESVRRAGYYLMEDIVERLAREVFEAGSQTAVGKKYGKSPSAICDILAGRKKVSKSLLKAMKITTSYWDGKE